MRAAIIGAGLAGRMLGWRLCELGAKVTLFDAKKRDHFGTGRVAAAMIAPSTEAVMTEPLVEQIGRRSLVLWKAWLDQLTASISQQVYFNQPGTLVVAHPQDDADWQRFIQHADTKLEPATFSHLNHSQLKVAAPELSHRFDKAAYFPDEAVLDNQQLYVALAQYFDLKGVQWFEDTPIDEVNENGRLPRVDQAFDWVFDCRGNGARPTQPELRSVRGEIIRVYAPEVNITQAVRLMHPRYPLYIVPKPDHEYVIGATQIESAHESPVTVRSGLELLSALYSLHSGFAEAHILRMDVGCRPAYPDNLPRIQHHNRRIQLNGLYRHGYLFTPALVEDVLALINGQTLNFPQVLH